VRINVFKKWRKILYTFGLILGVGLNASFCIAGIIFQPEPLIIALATVMLTFLIFIVFATIKKGNYHGMITIDETGLNFTTPWRHVHMDWEAVKYVTIHEKSTINFIGFFAEGFEKRPRMENKKYSTFWLIDLNLIDETFIFVEHREELMDEIKKYWDDKIINLEKLAS